MKILYYLCAIGEPNYNNKLKILKNNINILNITDLHANIYDDSIIPHDIVPNYTETRRPGTLAELWDWDDRFNEYDYIFFILDDVKLKADFNLNRIINKLEKFKFDIISPAIEGAGHVGLYPILNENYGINTARSKYLELFLYLMKPDVLRRYINKQDMTNPSTMGMDLLMYQFGFNCGVDYQNKAYHLYNAPKKAHELRTFFILNYLKRYGFNNIFEVHKTYGTPIEQLQILESEWLNYKSLCNATYRNCDI